VAGDLPLVEGAFVAPDGVGADEELLTFAPALEPRHILHEFGPRLRIAAAQEDDPAVESLEAFAARPEPLPDPSLLDRVGALGLSAFHLRSSNEYAAAKSDRRFAGAPWDISDATSPDPLNGAEAQMPEGTAGAPGRPSEPMRGRISVGLVIVEGPTGELAFSDEEQTKVVAEVQNGLSWLGSQAPGGDITWVYDIRPVAIDIFPDSADVGIEPLEARWRDPLLAKMGYDAGMAGVDAYCADLRSNLSTERAYCAFFTKYPLGHFAYASLGGPRLVMNYHNDGWHPDNIDRVYAHETGHIFGAPDEYRASGCDCGGSWGTSGGPNANCENCAPGGGVSCIMRNNVWGLCAATPGHFGW
jgi:hypothetical protein